MAEMVHLTIDGHEVSVPKRDHDPGGRQDDRHRGPPLLLPPGACRRPAMCRLCLVEVEGAPKPMPSCVTTVMPTAGGPHAVRGPPRATARACSSSIW